MILNDMIDGFEALGTSARNTTEAVRALYARFNRLRREFEAGLSVIEAVEYTQLQLDNPSLGWLDAAVAIDEKRSRERRRRND